MAECSQCHGLRDDGTFAGIPAMETCAGCHSEKMGTSKAEATLVDTYIKPGQETPWLVYAQQPANVWFSHAIHVKRANLACTNATRRMARRTRCEFMRRTGSAGIAAISGGTRSRACDGRRTRA